ncbi:MAG: M23 family metallopeptidase [Ruminococcus sp.]|nr:M23 family metallopeptidase [Ruminococcus sp.]MDE6678355.1 M23 family metallopeptidase [Ruminococcus sp.]
MKKNVLTENKIKGSKGFYVALGISAVMIGAACLFAYGEGEKITESHLNAGINSPDTAVDKKYNNVPKSTTTAYVVAQIPTTTEPVITTAVQVQAETIPIEEIIIETPEEEFNEVVADIDPIEEVIAPEDDSVETVSPKLDNVKPPLADISNVLTDFSGTELVKNETTGSWQTHNGTDFSAEAGSEVYAISNGEVTSVKKDALWGITVTVDHHNGFISKYCNLAEDLSVQEGDNLVSGDVIGLVGQTADIESALEPHLHFEITHNSTFTDPMSIIR